MINQDEIAKLAREYAEDSVDKYLPDTPLVPNARIRIVEAVKANTERLIRFLLRTHCIVSKEKVNEEYQKAQTQIKDEKELGIHGLITSGGAKEALLESLFDAETFKNSEV